MYLVFASLLTFGNKLGRRFSRAPTVGSAADVLSGVTGESPVDIEHNESEIVDHADAGTGSQRAAVVEPLDAHGSVADRFDAAVEVGGLAFDQVDVLDFADETRRIWFLLLGFGLLLALP